MTIDGKSSSINLYLTLSLPAGDTDVLPHVVDFLSEQGRMKFLRPLYRALYKSKEGKQLALDTFAAQKAKYHPIAAKMICSDLFPSADLEQKA